jgi:hypothetical protein
MSDNPVFQYDVFLSHSSKDEAVVRAVAERLRADWLQDYRVPVLCMSVDAVGSDWAQLKSGTFQFRDPLNKDSSPSPAVKPTLLNLL